MPTATRSCHHCQSTRHQLRAKTALNKALMVAYQCLDCGHKIENWIQHATLPMPVESLPAWDEQLAEQWYAARNTTFTERQKQLDVIRAQFDATWWTDYTAYLKTEKWRSKRALVMQRAGGWCQGCQKAEATQVHHLTYKHVTDELLWELVAVCDACHDRVHGPQPAVKP